MILVIWITYNIILPSKMESIENFDPNELKISSDEIKEYKSKGMKIIFNHDRKIVE